MYEVTVDPHRNTLPPLPSCLLARRPTREATVLCHNLKPTFPVIMPIYILSDCIAGKCLAPSYTAFATCDLEAGYLRSRSRLLAIEKQARILKRCVSGHHHLDYLFRGGLAIATSFPSSHSPLPPHSRPPIGHCHLLPVLPLPWDQHDCCTTTSSSWSSPGGRTCVQPTTHRLTFPGCVSSSTQHRQNTVTPRVPPGPHCTLDSHTLQTSKTFLP